MDKFLVAYNSKNDSASGRIFDYLSGINQFVESDLGLGFELKFSDLKSISEYESILGRNDGNYFSFLMSCEEKMGEFLKPEDSITIKEIRINSNVNNKVTVEKAMENLEELLGRNSPLVVRKMLNSEK